MLKLTNKYFINEYLEDLLDDRVRNLIEDYETNAYIDEATVNRDGEDINIELKLNIKMDEKQDIVNLFEKWNYN